MNDKLPFNFQFAFLLFCLFSGSCKNKVPTAFKEVQIDEKFVIQIPAFMHASRHPSPFRTVMQYQNDSAREYLMIFDTGRNGLHENGLKMYYDSIISQIAIDSARMNPPQFTLVNNDSAYKTEYSGNLNGVKIYNEVETIATPDRYYAILTWGRWDNKEQLKKDMNKILGSFTDIRHGHP